MPHLAVVLSGLGPQPYTDILVPTSNNSWWIKGRYLVFWLLLRGGLGGWKSVGPWGACPWNNVLPASLLSGSPCGPSSVQVQQHLPWRHSTLMEWSHLEPWTPKLHIKTSLCYCPPAKKVFFEPSSQMIKCWPAHTPNLFLSLLALLWVVTTLIAWLHFLWGNRSKHAWVFLFPTATSVTQKILQCLYCPVLSYVHVTIKPMFLHVSMQNVFLFFFCSHVEFPHASGERVPAFLAPPPPEGWSLLPLHWLWAGLSDFEQQNEVPWQR